MGTRINLSPFELIGITFCETRTFKRRIENFFRAPNYKLNELKRIRKVLLLEKATLIGDESTDSQCNCVPIIGYFAIKYCLQMHQIRQKVLKVIFQSDVSYKDLLGLSNSVSIYQRHL